MGWNGSGSRSKVDVDGKKPDQCHRRKGISQSRFRWVASCAGIVIFATGVALYLLNDRGEKHRLKSVGKKNVSKIAEVRPSKAKASDVEQDSKPEAEEVKEKPLSRKELIERETRKLNKPLDLNPTEKRPFRTETEKQLAKIFTTELGDRPPPPIPRIPNNERRHFAEILISDNPILPTDSDRVSEAKDAVMIAKKEMTKYIKEGGDPDSFIEYYYGVLNSAYEERRMYMGELLNVIKTDPAISEEMCNEMNKRLEKKGIKKIAFTEKMREKLGLEKQQ